MKLAPTDLSPARLLRMFSSAAEARRQRRPTDVLLLVLSLAVMLLALVNAPGPTTVDLAVVSVLDEAPALSWLWEFSYAFAALWFLVLVIAPVIRHRDGRLRIFWDYALALLVAAVMVAGVSTLGGTTLADAWDALLSADGPPVYPAARLAVITAVIVTASPHLTQPFRVVGRVTLVLAAVAAVALQVAYPSGATAGWAVGVAAASLVHLVRGSPGGQLTARQVIEALRDLGIEATSVDVVDPRAPGEQRLLAHAASGEDLEVKVYGRDAWDAQYLGSLWSSLTRRGEAPRLSVSRRERVEHEAMLSLIAERAGVPVQPVVTAGQGAQGEALVVTLAAARPFDAITPDEVDDVWLRDAWTALITLHGAGVAHRSITGQHLVERHDGSPALADFTRAHLAASRHDLMIDRVHLLVTLALALGNERAVDSAVQALGVEELTATLPYVQDPVLSPGLLRAMGTTWDLNELRSVAIDRTGAQEAPLVELRRVTFGSLLKLVLTVFVVASLVGLFAGVDLAAVAQELASANFALLALGMAVAPLAQVCFSFSTLGAALQKLPYVPVLMLQYAIQFIALVLPATAARLALQIRFFERLGISYGPATTIGAIDSFGGFVVQVILLLLIAVSSLPGFTTQVSGSSGSSDDSSGPSLLAIAVLIALLWAVVTLVVPRRRAALRRAIPRFIAQMRDQATESLSMLNVLRHPNKVARILVGNLGGQVVQAVVLGICLAAFGESASLSQLILVNTCVSLFAGLMPVPGGVGVAEAGFTYGLMAIGVPNSVAVSTAVAFRLITFYIPPLWCSQAMRWLRKNAYV